MSRSANFIRMFRNTVAGRLLALTVALYVLNVSMDSVDPVSAYAKEDLSVNDIESFVEFLVEEIADFDDFFKEYDDFETESSLQKSAPLFLCIPAPSFNLSPAFCIRQDRGFNAGVQRVDAAFLNISTPPPKAV